MESSGSSAKPVDPPGHRWSQILGTAIALFTLAIPTVLIAYYSTADALNAAPSPNPSTLQQFP